MCGIIACLNCKNQIQILLEGLNQLQNRGYDSCGISILENELFKTQKYASTKEEQGLQKLQKNINLPQTNIGIAHTRWATHGAKNDTNAHPHIDFYENVSLVHNGIITNYMTLKKKLISEGFNFYGETDTEVVSNLISYHLQKEEEPFAAFKNAISQLEGSWGLVVIIKSKPNSLFISKSGSPLLLGRDNDGLIVGSEISAFCNRSNTIISLEEGDLMEINSDNISTGDGEFNSLSVFFKNRDVLSLEDSVFQINPYPFPHWMIKEIMEQPIAIQRTLNYGARILGEKIKLGGLSNNEELLKNKDEIIILGCGTSLNAGIWISYILKKKKIFKNVKIIDASEFEIYEITEPKKTICVVLSQSGETKDVHRCMVKIKGINIPIIGIVNSVGSLIARESDCGIYLNAGREVSVASTKSFVCQQIALTLMTLWFHQTNNSFDIFIKDTIKELQFISSHVENTLMNMEKLKEIARQLVDHKSCFLLGKNIFEPIAREGALKLKEIGYIHAEAFAGGSLKHGPFSLIEEGLPIFLFIMDDLYKEFMLNTYEEVKSRGANVIIISNMELKVKNLIKIPKLNNLGSILSIFPIQIIAYEMALLKGHNPDYPRNLAKVVTVD
jgi:glutamine---fructose-6-phosphate transaminase (isomerizing)